MESEWIEFVPSYRDGTVKTKVQAHYARYQKALNLPRRTRPITLSQFGQVHAEWGYTPYRKPYCIECSTNEKGDVDEQALQSSSPTCKAAGHRSTKSHDRVRYLRLHTPQMKQ